MQHVDFHWFDTRPLHTQAFHWFSWPPLTLMFHPFCQWANHVFSIMSTWQQQKTVVILAPSCNLDVYINYFYNQLTHTLLEVCVCVCIGMCAYTSSFYVSECDFSVSFLYKVGATHYMLVRVHVCVHACRYAYMCVNTWNQY